MGWVRSGLVKFDPVISFHAVYIPGFCHIPHFRVKNWGFCTWMGKFLNLWWFFFFFQMGCVFFLSFFLLFFFVFLAGGGGVVYKMHNVNNSPTE